MNRILNLNMSRESSLQSPSLQNLLTQHSVEPGEWTQPCGFNLNDDLDRQRLESAFASGAIRTVRDSVEVIANDLFELRHPEQKSNDGLREEFVADIMAKGERFGRWFLFPWSRELVRYPDKDSHRDLRTSRNRNLITHAEQRKLYESTVAVFGLSVGSNVIGSLVLSGVGGKIVLADMDDIEPSNLNRINGSMHDVGVKKIDLVAQKISEIDPYIEQAHLRDGVTADNLDEAIEQHCPDVLIDEVDDLTIKALIRLVGQREKIPVLMASDVGDRSVIDIERYDLESIESFNGRIKERDLQKLLTGSMSDTERKKLMIKIVGVRNITPRLIQSVTEIDKTLSGIPQLGTAAIIGGGLATIAVREMLLGRRVTSGKYVFSPKKTLGLQPQVSRREAISTMTSFLKG